jgi:hypothetical protein
MKKLMFTFMTVVGFSLYQHNVENKLPSGTCYSVEVPLTGFLSVDVLI